MDVAARARRLRRALRTGALIAEHPAVLVPGAPGQLPPLAGEIGLREDAVLVVPTSGQIVFRLLGRSAARQFDFQTARDRDRPIRPGQDFMDYLGLSVFGTEQAATAAAMRFPKLIARVHLRADEGFMIARTMPDVAEHYSVWGDPQALVGRVVHITRIDSP